MPIEPENKPPVPKKPRPNPMPSQSTWWLVIVLAIVLAFILYSAKGAIARKSPTACSAANWNRTTSTSVESPGRENHRRVQESRRPTRRPSRTAGTPAAAVEERSFRPRCRRWAASTPIWINFCCERLDGRYKASEPPDNTFWVMAFPVLVFVLLLAGMWFMFRKARDSFFSGGLTGGFTKSGARRYEQGEQPITFADVAGLEGVKNELQEIVEFLRDPAKFQRLGAACPRAFC